MLVYVCDWCHVTCTPHWHQLGPNETSEPQPPRPWIKIENADVCTTCAGRVKQLRVVIEKGKP